MRTNKLKKILSRFLTMMIFAFCNFYTFSVGEPEPIVIVDIIRDNNKSEPVFTKDVLHEYNPLTRDKKPPEDENFENLNGATYELEGSFKHLVYTNYWFHSDGNGKLSFDITINEDEKELPRQMKLTVRLYSIKTNKMVAQTTAFAFCKGGDWYEPFVNISGTFTGLNNIEGYYIELEKGQDGFYADISGTISTP